VQIVVQQIEPASPAEGSKLIQVRAPLPRPLHGTPAADA
jgi:hypothetical protein